MIAINKRTNNDTKENNYISKRMKNTIADIGDAIMLWHKMTHKN